MRIKDYSSLPRVRKVSSFKVKLSFVMIRCVKFLNLHGLGVLLSDIRKAKSSERRPEGRCRKANIHTLTPNGERRKKDETEKRGGDCHRFHHLRTRRGETLSRGLKPTWRIGKEWTTTVGLRSAFISVCLMEEENFSFFKIWPRQALKAHWL